MEGSVEGQDRKAVVVKALVRFINHSNLRRTSFSIYDVAFHPNGNQIVLGAGNLVQVMKRIREACDNNMKEKRCLLNQTYPNVCVAIFCM